MKYISTILLSLLLLSGCSKENEPIQTDTSKTVKIISIIPASAKIGDEITITGTNFGDSKLENSVSFNGIEASEYTFWINTQIKVIIPDGVMSGKISVRIDDTHSNEIYLTVREPYDSVRIGSQVWMTVNLDVDRYRNGDIIPEVTDTEEWYNLKTGAWCYYNNDPELGAVYGKLYNWYAVNDSRGLAHDGWHIPTDEEWATLSDYLGGADVAGGKMKTWGTIEAGTGLWSTPNEGATNESGFSALPAGWLYYRYETCENIGLNCNWWSSTEYGTTDAWSRSLYYFNTHLSKVFFFKGFGFSVRCIRD